MQMANNKNKSPNYIHTLLLSLAVVMCWRGAWGLMDVYLFPNDEVTGFVISIIIGSLAIVLLENRKVKDFFN
jgi:hypothetical protein